jgi:phage virion morphogenesis protein
MAGTLFEIDHNSDEIYQAFNEVLTRAQNSSPVMAEIAEYLHLQTREHFDNEEAPDGTPWAPLSETTLAFRAQAGLSVDKILHQSLMLRDQIHPFYDAESAGVSTGQSTSAYAAMQQFGGTTSSSSMIPGVEIPARPYLGLSDDDEQYVVELLGDFLVDVG